MVNELFHGLCEDELVWKAKCMDEFGFNWSPPKLSISYKECYKRLCKPSVVLWGDEHHSIMVNSIHERNAISKENGIYRNPEFDALGIYIVDITFGENCVWAIDRKGRLFFWGTVPGSGYASQPYSRRTFKNVMRLEIGTPIVSIASDNFNSIAIDIKGNVWIIICPDHPFLLKSDLINNGHADSTPIQVVCNFYYSAILTRSGDVYIVYPFDEYVTKAHEKHCEESGTGLEIEGNRISCKTWKLKYELYKLREIGDLPELDQRHGSKSPSKIISIVAMYKFLIGLTDKGHVLKINQFDSSSKTRIKDENWVYIEKYYDPENPVTHIAGRRISSHAIRATNLLAIRKSEDRVPSASPKSIAAGCTHAVVRGLCGRVQTRGYNYGHALGRYDLKEDEYHDICEVHFGEGKFCIGVGAGKNQSGALVADLNPIPDLNPVTD
ncbi:RCC1 BLIP-II [Pyrrhoderma noxium]|uniref:RCC1 BLIP-II n=1 Tax=Pyrrhoderma noxium TaxID=2282107 RepID=A0A286UT59_9AGAM|nr:RCC1 BLIP-II [Pyrrhoderma noxium]